jgi:hypothetical protein
MSSPRITYTPRPDATPEGEISALAAVYRFILFESRASKEAARPGDLDDAKVRSKGDSRAKRIIPERP